MKFSRICTLRDTYVPGALSKEPGSRLADFAVPHYTIEKIGDAVHITRGSETNVIPWDTVIGAMLLPVAQEEPVPTPALSRQLELSKTGPHKGGRR